MKLNNFKLAVRRFFFEEILVIGDSHVDIFKHKDLRRQFNKLFFNVCSVGGATVSGLVNPNSTTQALPRFRKAIKSSKAKTTIVNLGEVDTGFVIWYRAQKNECDVQDMLDAAVINYQCLLDEIGNKSKVICISAPLPTIKDEQNWGDVANLRNKIKTKQLARTELTIKFNKKIESYCAEKKYFYMNLDRESLSQKGVLRDIFIHPNPTDHHYNPKYYVEIIVDKLKVILT